MIIKRVAFSLALAAFILLVALLLNYADRADIVSADLSRRTMQVIVGLVLALYANQMPKDIGQWRGSARAAAAAQSALRTGGWSLTLAGLAYAGLWALAPLAVADLASMAVVATAMVITIAYAGWAFTSCGRAKGREAGL